MTVWDEPDASGDKAFVRDRYYKADPIDWSYRPCTMQEWAIQFEGIERHIADDEIDGWKYRERVLFTPVRVSTVWLGLDHSFGREGQPLLFETMIFGGRCGQDCERYSTVEAARRGHIRLLRRALLARMMGRRLATWLT